jgi:hypothetical protein
VLLRIRHHQRAFLSATKDYTGETDQQQLLREFHDVKYTRAASRF